MEKHYSKSELAKLILKHVALGGMILVCVALPGMAQVLNLLSLNNKYDKRKVSRALRRLERKKSIRIYTKNNKDIVEIIKHGKTVLLQYEFNEINIKIPKKWDGKWRLVFFDIPSKRERSRKLLRMKLDEFGFKLYQKSVFIFPYECRKEIDFISHYLYLDKYILYVIAEKVDNEEFLKKAFRLK